jgi:prepilin-type N-terminal cleavage/methylation domain-containing protein
MIKTKSTNRLRAKKGFTLVELITVVIILGLLVAVGGRYIIYSIDAKKYNETLERLIIIRNAIVGDANLVVLGNRADLGYFENNYSFPAAEAGNTVPIAALRDYLPPIPELDTLGRAEAYKQDAWGNNFEYLPSVAQTFGGTTYNYVRIKSFGANGTNVVTGDALDEDIEVLIRRDLYLTTMVKANIMDARGVILRGVPNRATMTGAPWTHQVYVMRLENAAGATRFGTDSAGVNQIYYFQGLFSSRDDSSSNPVNWINHPIPAGFYRMHVWPTNGSAASAQGIRDHRNDLSGSNVDLSQPVIIYPKDPAAVNFLEFRFPGQVDATEL